MSDTDPMEADSQAAGWYEATRVASPARPSLNFDLDVDVCVVGAGLAGLTAAREIAQRGWSVAVLEANRVAGAASGRNTGFVLPGFGAHIDDVVERVGLDRAKELWALSEQGLDYVRRTIADAALPGVDPQPGWLHISKTDDGKDQRTYVERLRWIGAQVELWQPAQVREQLVNPRYFSAVHFPTAFHIHPLNYALGLAALAEKAGARIFEGSPATSIDTGGVRKRIGTPNGNVRAGHVVLAGNVDLGALMPRLSATLLPVSTFVMVTQPLGPALDELVRYRGAISDTNRADNHYRVVGGANPVETPMVRPHARLASRSALDQARASRRHQTQFSRAWAKSKSRICGAALWGAPSTACRRSARSSAASGWRAALAGTGSIRRPWAANWWRAAWSRATRPGGCLRPMNWSGPAACSAASWRRAFIGERGPPIGSHRVWRAIASGRDFAARRESANARPRVAAKMRAKQQPSRVPGQIQVGTGATYSFDSEALW